MDNLNWLIVCLVILFVARIFSILRKSFKRIKKMKEQFKELDKNKCKGPHSWVEMDILGKKTFVCKECYWCTEVEGYVKKNYVEAHLKNLEFEDKLKEYVEKEKNKILQQYNLKKEDLESILNKINNAKKDFTIKWLDDSLEKLKKRDESE